MRRQGRPAGVCRVLFLWVILGGTVAAQAQLVNPAHEDVAAAIERRRLEALERAQGTSPALRAGASPRARPVPDEAPCRVLSQLHVVGPQDLANLLRAEFAAFADLCLGARSLEALRQNLDAALVDAGYVTSRTALPEQSLTSGTLIVQALAGRVASVEESGPGSGVVRQGLLPLRSGDVLNVRALDQALDVLNRRKGVRSLFKLEPGSEEGTTRIVVVHEPVDAPVAHASATALIDDDYGSMRADIAGAWDDPLGAVDVLHWQLSSTIGRSGAFQRSAVGAYSWPWGQSLFSLSASISVRRLPVQGTTVTFVSRGRESSLSLRWNRTLWRSATHKFGLSASLGERRASSALDDTELVLQRRVRAHAELGFDSWWRADAALWSGSLRYGASRRSGSRNPFLANDDAPTNWLDASLAVSTRVDAGPFQTWKVEIDAQRLGHAGAPSDQFVIGGTDTVRGFTVREALAGESGVVLRQEIHAAPIGGWAASAQFHPFLALDYGVVRGPSTAALTGRSLASASLGVRVSGVDALSPIQVDLQLSAPLHAPGSAQERTARRWLPAARISVAL